MAGTTTNKIEVGFRNYLLSLIGSDSGALCSSKGQEYDDPGGRLRFLHCKETSKIEMWEKMKDKATASNNLMGLWKYTVSSCMKIEAWWDNLKNGGHEGGFYNPGTCSVGHMAVSGGRLNYGQNCVINKNHLTWDSSGNKREFYTNRQEDRSLSICRDIILQMMYYFEIVNTDSSTRSKLSNPNPCQDLYESLVRWGGTQVAEAIMTDWFIGDSSGTPGGISQSLKGIDLYEVMTETVYGDGRGDKSIRCRLAEGLESSGTQASPKYKTEYDKGMELSECRESSNKCSGLEEILQLGQSPDEEISGDITSTARIAPENGTGGDGTGVSLSASAPSYSGSSFLSSGDEDSNIKRAPKTPPSVSGGSASIGWAVGASVGILLGLVSSAYGYYRVFYMRSRRRNLMRAPRLHGARIAYA
ncbi:hypothetical protein C922_05133 [Plasmodium inui San Antonio 1]|uniref:Uncharacterized protein n=1 Tax=Plasmodium inui San Antonio 1 TaxID=1237626 RepID=W6ZYR6_9APIC|nr:hypothetical protein C922_05133 [Plasmodium inui San Antonio 1]EUD64493.1 hypothetical protein C922_05133 [Plasmodium inui San Antonio 1]